MGDLVLYLFLSVLLPSDWMDPREKKTAKKNYMTMQALISAKLVHNKNCIFVQMGYKRI
jgi:hypothetical protein